MRPILPSLRHAPSTLTLILLLEIVKSDLFRPVDGQSVEVTIGPRQTVEIGVIGLCFLAQGARWRRIVQASRGLPPSAIGAVAIYFATIGISILTSLNPGLSLIRAAECFSYVSVALVWGANIAAARRDAFMPTLQEALLTLCRFLIGLQVCVALVHARDASVFDQLKSNSYSIVCAALFALTLATRGLGPRRGLGTAVLGLVLFQSLTSVLASLAVLAWLALEGAILKRHAVFLRARALLGAGLVVFAMAAYPAAVGAVEGVGQLMGRDAKSITNLTGRAELWGNLIQQISADPGRFALGLGYGVGERVYVQKFNEDYKRDMASIGIVDVTIHSHSHNVLLSAIINIGFLGAVAIFGLYFVPLLLPPIRSPLDARAAFVLFLVAAVQAISTNLFAANDLLSLAYVVSIAVPRRPRDMPRWRHVQAMRGPPVDRL